RPAAAATFTELVRQTRDRVHEALEHQDYPFGLLVKRLQPRRDPSRSPVFQVMFIWDKPGQASHKEADADGLRLEPLVMEQRGAPSDLTLIVFEEGERLTASIRYNADLFDAATIARWAGHLDTLLNSIVDDPKRPLADLPILSPAER